MAKTVTKKTVDDPVSLTLDLFAPGMTTMHRAGLGGLVCCLRAMERDVRGNKFKGDHPGGNWQKQGPPWTIEETRVTLSIGEPTAAGEWLKALFEYSFRVQNELFFIPGQYGATPPSEPGRSDTAAPAGRKDSPPPSCCTPGR